MKTVFLLGFILISSFAFSQTKDDLTDIINLVIEKYQTDSILVYNRFENNKLLSDFERKKLSYYNIKSLDDDRLNEFYIDTLKYRMDYANTKYFELLYYPNSEDNILEKKNNKRINRYTDIKLRNNTKKYPLAFISYPLISIDNKKAIAYGRYVCGPLCGSGGIFFLEKIEGVWKIIDYQMRWIS